ncbi:type II toxin-antitoxin system PemK/MazF family toxin [Candidatus Woesearchaeota archaeon]|nr:type II toxin-antitoxin system PemK/MazF family toxin [Candidatus Woesearchaeota archaeon]
MFEQKDIVLIPFPYSDLSGAKQRPALIISNNAINKTQDRICCLITSNNHHDGIIINNSSFEQGDLPFESWIKPHRLFTIHEKIIKKKLCKITDRFHDKILSSITELLKRT